MLCDMTVFFIQYYNNIHMTSIKKSFCQLILQCQWITLLERYNPCLTPDVDFDNNHLSNFLENYKEKSHYEDRYFGEAYMLQYIDPERVHEYIIMRRIRYSDSILSEIYYNKCLKRKQLNHSNIINLLELGKKKGQGFVFTTYNIYEIYDYILIDLQREFINRINEKRVYEQQEIILILKQCIEGIQYLAKNKIQHGSIRLNNIYVSNKGQFKLGYRELFDYKSNLEKIKNNQNHLIYLSPGQLEQLKRNSFNQNQKDIYSQNGLENEKNILNWRPAQRNWNIYSLGMCILNLMYGNSSLDYIYNYKNFTIDQIKLELIYKRISSKYSERLLKIIKYMLEFSNYQKLLQLIDRLTLKTTQFRLSLLNGIGTKENSQKIIYYDLQTIKPPVKHNYPNHLSKILYPNITVNQQLLRVKSKSIFGTNTTVSASLKIQKNNKIQYQFGGQFIGNIQDQEKNGKGLYKHGDGQYYIGDWKNNKMHGKGWLYWNEEKIRYEGNFQADQFHGQGIEYPKQFPKIEVQYTDIYIYKNNWKKYDGNFKRDKRQGKGIIHFLNGYWEGNFKNNQPNGQGVWHPTSQHTQKIAGRWVDGQLQLE